MVAAMRNLDLRRYGPVIVILALVAVPLAIWAATSGGSDSKEKQGLLVERSVSVTGAPELVISLVGGGVEVTTPTDTVRIECMDKDGNVIIKGTQPWPFVEEPGYPYAHVHQSDSPEKIQGARRCRVLGTNTRLEAGVK
jgi:hypothetical protein